MSLAGGAVLASLILLLLYVNRFTHGLRSVAVAAAGARVVDQAAGAASGRAVRDVDVSRLAPPVLTVTSGRNGTIQAVSARRLLREARRHDCVLVLVRSVGDFVPDGTPLMTVHGASPPGGRRLEGLVATGVERTIEQDPAFALRILVDIAIRALSPAVNDPTTAVQVLDYVEQFLHVLAPLPLSASYGLVDDAGRLRVVVPGRSWEEFVSRAVTEIRMYGATAPQVCRRLRAVLEGLLADAPDGKRAAVAAELGRLDADLARTFPDAGMHAFAGFSDRQGIGGRPPGPVPVPAPREPDVVTPVRGGS